MPHPFNNQAADEVSRAWDDFVVNRPTTSGDDTIDALYALDDAPYPDRAYISALRQNLLAVPSQSSRGGKPASPVSGGSGELKVHPPTPISIRERRSRYWEFAAVAAVLALLIGGVVMLRPEPESRFSRIGSSGSPTASFHATATQTATTDPSPTATATTASATTPPQAAIAGMTPISVLDEPERDGRLLTLYEATVLAGAFLGVPINDLAAEFIPLDAFPPTYRVTHTVPDVIWPDEVVVDADTGWIMSATLPSRSSLGAPINEIDNAKARAIAESFGRSAIIEFNQLTLTEEDAPGGWAAGEGVGDELYRVQWSYQEPDSGVWLPISLTVSVDLRTANVHSFDIMRGDYDGPTEPIIEELQAIAIALADARAEHGAENIDAESIRLVAVWYPTVFEETDNPRHSGTVLAGEYRLAWQITLSGLPDNATRRVIDVNALTGDIINPIGSPHG